MNLIDLTHPLFHAAPAFPNDPKLAIYPHGTIATHGYNISQIVTGSHQGTHLDAMRHFYAQGRTIDRMPLQWFYGPARVLRIPKAPRQTITVADLQQFEIHLQPEAKIFIDTGWYRAFGTDAFFNDFPGLTQDAARYLVERKIRVLALDIPTVGEDVVEIHRILLHPDAEIVIVESVANLDQVPDSFIWSGFPLPWVEGDGSPIRSVAICESDPLTQDFS